MAKEKKALAGIGGGEPISRAFFDEEEPSVEELKIEKVYTLANGYMRMQQKHDARLNVILPTQLLDVFGKITEREVGSRERSSVLEHLIIKYCEEHGAIIEK